MEYWETQLLDDPVIQLIKKVGSKQAAEAMEMSGEDLDNVVTELRYLHDMGNFAEECLKITDKLGKIVPLKANFPQRRMIDAIEGQKARNKPVRLCLLKARQWGGSTLGEGYIYRDNSLRPYRSSLIVAHGLESARHLRAMSERFHDYNLGHRVDTKKESDKWWRYRHVVDRRPADSHLRIDTADEISGGHSLTLHNLHLSEIQLWRNAQELVKGLFPTVPDVPDTFVFMEGTGSGIGNYWYDFCQMAMSKEQKEWEFLFIPWFEIEGYSQDFEDGKDKAEFEKHLDNDEKHLQEHENCTLEQLFWRRNKINLTLKKDIDAFHQQFPATPDEAFVASGRQFFPVTTVRNRFDEAKLETPKTGDLVFKQGTVIFEEQENGYWQIWEDRVLGMENLYVVGADVAEGIAVVPELGNRGGDFSVARVLRRDIRKFVATFRQRVDTDVFEVEMWKAGMYWGAALFPEQNGETGGALVRGLKDRPGAVLLRTPDFGRRRDRTKDEFGWETSKNTRRILTDDLKEEVRDHLFDDPDSEFWSECLTFVLDEKGKPQAQLRKYDDTVMATGITIQADKLLPVSWRVRPRKSAIKPPAGADVKENWKPDTRSLTREEILRKNLTDI